MLRRRTVLSYSPARLTAVPEPLEAVEDQIEAELEVVQTVVMAADNLLQSISLQRKLAV